MFPPFNLHTALVFSFWKSCVQQIFPNWSRNHSQFHYPQQVTTVLQLFQLFDNTWVVFAGVEADFLCHLSVDFGSVAHPYVFHVKHI